MEIAGYKIWIQDRPISQEQFRFPRTKRRRIRRKWEKRPANFRPVFLKTPLLDEARRIIICNARHAEMLRRELMPLPTQRNLS
jgi:hypothetical protein